ncbi:MAG: C25 family cysteine peptidase, partial [Fibrobacter sp.]|nr:C25 family cysteine peptidase [Fibrobacter sp.]
MVKRSLLLLFIVVLSVSAQVKVLENSTSKFSFSWEISRFDTVSVKDGRNSSVSLGFMGENMLIGEIGEPAIPGYSLVVGVPSGGDVSAVFSPEEITTVRLSSPLRRVFSTIKETRHENLNFNSAWISEPIYSKIGNLKTAQFVIKPFVYDSVSNVVKVVTRGSCTINFPSSHVLGGVQSLGRTEYDKMMNNLVLNYSVAKRWSVKKLGKRANVSYPINPDAAYMFKIGDGHAEVNEATTDENGIVKISGNAILRRFGTVGVNQVVLHGSFKGELPSEIPSESTMPDGIVEIPLLRIDQNGNGLVDNEDVFLGYVTGATDWAYDSNRNDFALKLDRYDDYRHYWISIKNGTGLSMKKYVPVGGTADTSIVNFDNRVVYKRSLQEYSSENCGTDWIWAKLTPMNSVLERNLPLLGLDTNYGGTISIKRANSNSGEVDISIAGQIHKNCNNSTNYDITTWGDKWLRLILSSSTDSSYSRIEQFQINYKRKLESVGGDRYNIFSPLDSNRVTRYNFTKTTNELVYILRIPSDETQISLIDTIRAVGTYTWNDTGFVQYFVCSESKLTELPSEEQYQPAADNALVVKNLRMSTNAADFLIITHPEFINEAIELAQHKKSRFNNPKVVSLHDVYRYFSGGDTDPSAIRNFLAYVKNTWNSDGLLYVVIFGSAHYDYKNLKYTVTNYFPTYYYNDKAVDDYYVYINSDSLATNL